MRIKEYSNFSIIDILITQELNGFLVPIKRHTLYERIKSLSSKDNVISVSNFYKRLTDLEKQGFIKSNLNKSGKIATIEPTELTISLNISLIKYLFTVLTCKDLQKEHVLEYGKKIFKKIGKQHFDKFLYILNSDLLVLYLETIRYISQITECVNLLSQVRYNDFFSVTEMKKYKVKYTDMDEYRIREPDNIFDSVYIEIYTKRLEFQGLTKIELLKEIFRVTKPKSPVVVLGYKKKSSGSVDIIDYILRAYPKISNELFEREELIDDLTNAGLENIEIIEHKGRLIGIGYVP